MSQSVSIVVGSLQFVRTTRTLSNPTRSDPIILLFFLLRIIITRFFNVVVAVVVR